MQLNVLFARTKEKPSIELKKENVLRIVCSLMTHKRESSTNTPNTLLLLIKINKFIVVYLVVKVVNHALLVFVMNA
jgi:hypothetical protein